MALRGGTKSSSSNVAKDRLEYDPVQTFRYMGNGFFVQRAYVKSRRILKTCDTKHYIIYKDPYISKS